MEGKNKNTYSSNTTQKASDLRLPQEFYKKKNILTISVTKRNLASEEAYGAAAARLTKAFGGIMPDTDPDIDPITPAEWKEQHPDPDSDAE